MSFIYIFVGHLVLQRLCSLIADRLFISCEYYVAMQIFIILQCLQHYMSPVLVPLSHPVPMVAGSCYSLSFV